MFYLNVLKEKLSTINSSIEIKTQGGIFTVEPVKTNNILLGVNVSNLGNNNFLPIEVFAVTISLLICSENNEAQKGNAMRFKLGNDGLALNSVEGHVALVIYGQKKGNIVFRRITPISHILAWAGICKNCRGFLKLLP